MPQRDHKTCVRSAFEPLAEAANCNHLLAELCTRDIPDDRKERQFARYKAFVAARDKALPLSGGGFIAVLSGWEDCEVVVVSSSALNDNEWINLRGFCEAELGFTLDEYDESAFLVVCDELKDFIRLDPHYRNSKNAQDIIDIIDDEYSGHEIFDLIKCYQASECFIVDRSNNLSGASIESLSLPILNHSQQLRSPIVDDEFASLILELKDMYGCTDERLFLALSASQWRHVFLEVYKCIESLFHFPWTIRLKYSLGYSGKIDELRKIIHTEIGWRFKERDAIGRLFDLTKNNDRIGELENEIKILKSVVGNEGYTRRALGEAIYNVRNVLVHSEDKDRLGEVPPDADEIRNLAIYLVEILKAFHQEHGGNF